MLFIGTFLFFTACQKEIVNTPLTLEEQYELDCFNIGNHVLERITSIIYYTNDLDDPEVKATFTFPPDSSEYDTFTFSVDSSLTYRLTLRSAEPYKLNLDTLDHVEFGKLDISFGRVEEFGIFRDIFYQFVANDGSISEKIHATRSCNSMFLRYYKKINQRDSVRVSFILKEK